MEGVLEVGFEVTTSLYQGALENHGGTGPTEDTQIYQPSKEVVLNPTSTRITRKLLKSPGPRAPPPERLISLIQPEHQQYL